METNGATTSLLWRNFGAEMRRRREVKRLSQAGAASLADIDRQQWYRIENGLSGTKRETVIRIARAVDWPAHEALDLAGFGLPKEDSGKPQNVAEFVQRLSEMGFDLGGFDLEDAAELGPDDLQDLLDDIEAKILLKTSRKSRKDRAA